MRAIPESMDLRIVADIDARLRGVVDEHSVTIPWAIESGSRAWGFPSPDSDYDCRFLYVRARDSYLSPWPARDVIETPLDRIFDVNGWDLAKALRLLVKGNATVTEWLRSPIVYAGDEGFRNELLALAESVWDPVRAGRHYLHVGRQQIDKHRSTTSLKRVFYALRPAATIRWLSRFGGSGIPPMDLPTLVTEIDAPRPLTEAIDELIALKAITRELGDGEIPPVVATFIAEELARGEALYERASTDAQADAVALCHEFFIRTIDRIG